MLYKEFLTCKGMTASNTKDNSLRAKIKQEDGNQ